jgi:hypothetical protein
MPRQQHLPRAVLQDAGQGAVPHVSERQQVQTPTNIHGIYVAHNQRNQHTSIRCSRTGRLYSRRTRSAPFTLSTTAERIWTRPSSSHAPIRVLRAVSPSPNSVVTAESESGSERGSGRASTERAKAVRVKPCCLTRGTASFNSCALEILSLRD